MTILSLVKSFKTMKTNHSKRIIHNVLWRNISWKVYKIGTWHTILIQSLFKSSICAIKIWDRYLWQLGHYALFGNVAIIFSSFFIITFDWNGNFEFWWFHWKDLVQIYQNITFFKFKKQYFFKSKVDYILIYLK